jgi:hypothetical protein
MAHDDQLRTVISGYLDEGLGGVQVHCDERRLGPMLVQQRSAPLQYRPLLVRGRSVENRFGRDARRKARRTGRHDDHSAMSAGECRRALECALGRRRTVVANDHRSLSGSGDGSAPKRTLDVPRPGGRRVAGRKRPLAHLVDGWPRRRLCLVTDLVDCPCGRFEVGRASFGHAVQCEFTARLTQWGRRSTDLRIYGLRAPDVRCIAHGPGRHLRRS